MPRSFPSRSIVAIHGSGSSGKQWKSLAEAAAPAFEVRAPSLPDSDAETRLHAVLGAVGAGPGPAHLVAHSFGASVAMRVANAVPDQIASVVLYDPVVAVPGDHGFAPPRTLQRLSCAMQSGESGDGMARFLDFWAGAGSWTAASPRRRDAMLARYGSILRDFEQLFAGHWTPDEVTYRGPLTLLRGGRSPAVIRETTAYLSRAYDLVACHLLPDLDHMTPLTQPKVTDDLFLKAIADQCARDGMLSAA